MDNIPYSPEQDRLVPEGMDERIALHPEVQRVLVMIERINAHYESTAPGTGSLSQLDEAHHGDDWAGELGDMESLLERAIERARADLGIGG